MNNHTCPSSKARRPENRPSFLRASLVLLAALLAWAPLLHAQTVVMQDDFNYKTADIDGHSPTKGIETWKKWYDGVISTDGTQASIINEKLESDAQIQGRASYPFNLAENTIYTLKATFKFKPKEKDIGAWVGFGFGIGEAGNIENSPWMIINPQTEASDDSLSHGFVGEKEVGHAVISTSDFSVPVTAKITWNTHTGEVEFFINNELQSDWAQKAPPSGDGYRIFFGGMGYCHTVKVTNITLSSEPINKK